MENEAIVIGHKFFSKNSHDRSGSAANSCFDWDEVRIRMECRAGTEREREAYINAGLMTPRPGYIPPPAPTPQDLHKYFADRLAKGYLVTCPKVRDAVMKKHKLGKGSIGRRIAPVSAAKREIVSIVIDVMGLTFRQAGRGLGIDHSTVMHHYRRWGKTKK